VLSLHSSILDDRRQFRIPTQDRLTDGLAVGPELFGYLDHRDVADDIKRGRKGWAESGRNVHDVLVTPDGCEAFVKLPLLRGKSDIDSLGGRQQDRISFPGNPEMLLEQASRQEVFSNRFGAFSRNDDGPGPHGSGEERGG